MKKALSILLSVIMIFSILPIGNVAANNSSFTVTTSSVSGTAGSEVEVDFITSNNTGFNSLEFTVNFDKTKVKIVSFEKKMPIPDGYTDTALNSQIATANNRGVYTVSWCPDIVTDADGMPMQSPIIYYNGVVATLKFQILEGVEDGTVVPITLTKQYACFDDLDLTEVPVSVADGSVTVAACDHAYNTNELTQTQAPTCSEVGKKTATCSVCGEELTEDIPVDADAHVWGEWAITRMPNCTDAGEKQRVCLNNASHIETAEVGIFADAHNWSEWVETVKGSCIIPSVLERYCLNNTSHIETKNGPIVEDAHSYSYDGDTECDNCGAERIFTSGTTGDCTWKLDGTVLTISGNGAMDGYGCYWDRDIITKVIIEDGVTNVTSNAFCECPNLTTVELGNTITIIDDAAFMCCYNLRDIIIPQSVRIIDEFAFSYCISLRNITIPDSVVQIGDCAFENCTYLTDVYYMGLEREKEQITIKVGNQELENATWHYASCIGSSDHIYDNSCDGICNVCNKTRIAPHNFGEWVETVTGTCSTPSVLTRLCLNDPSHIENKGGSINPDAHNWGEWTETSPGIETRVCKNNANHTETKESIVPEVKDFTISASNVSGTAGSEVEVDFITSNNTGFNSLEFTVNFDKTKVKIVSFEKKLPIPDGYTDTALNSQIATANNRGVYTVSWCPDILTDADGMPMQNPIIYYNGVVATLKLQILEGVEDGTVVPITLTKQYACFDDLDLTEVPVSVAAGSITVEAAQVEECDHSGNTNELVETQAPTCSIVGKKTATCSVCGEELTEDIPVDVNAHAWGEWVETTPGTCTTPSVETRLCLNDPSHVDTQEGSIDPNAHDMGNWEVTTAPTCTTIGIETKTCKNGCGHTENQIVANDANAHNMGNWELTTPATCTTEGEETRTCKHGCGHTETQAVAIDPTAHNWGEWTETSPGVETRVCKNNANHTETKKTPVVTGNFTLTASNVSGKAGSEVEVDIVASNNTGFNSLEFKVAFDKTKLQVVSFEKKLPLPDDYTETALNPQIPTANSRGLLNVNWCPDVVTDADGMPAQNTIIDYNGVIYTVKFKILEGVEAGEVIPVTLKDQFAMFDDLDMTEVPVSVAAGSVTVEAKPVRDFTLTASNASGTAGSEVEVDIVASNNTGFNSLEFKVAFDKTKLQVVSYEKKLPLPDDYTETALNPQLSTVNSKGLLYASWCPDILTDADGMPAQNTIIDFNGVIYTVKFKILEGVEAGEVIPVTLKDQYACFDDLDLTEVPVFVAAGSITVEAAQVEECDHSSNTNELVETQAPTCSAVGKKTATCSVCGEELTEDIPVDKNAHNWGAWVDSTPGFEERTCLNDASHTESREKVVLKVTASELSGAAGSEVEVDFIASNNTGFNSLEFIVNFDVNKLQIVSFEKKLPLPDGYIDVALNSQIATSNRTGIYTISWCPDILVDENGMPMQSPVIDFNGVIATLKFKILGNAEIGEVLSISLTDEYACFDDIDLTEVPVVVENGDITVNACDHSGNTNEFTVNKAPTCVAIGEKTVTCSICGKTLSEDIPVDPTAHDMSDWEVTTPATCTTEGVETRVCKHGCGHTETQAIAIDVNAHAWGEWVETAPGNCTTPAVLTRICSHNSAHKETKDGNIVADAHDMGEWTLTTAPTCTTEGVETRTCKRGCSYTETQAVAIDPNAHDMGNWEVTTPATCTTEGVETRICKHGCGHTETKAIAINPNAHDMGEWELTTPATCTTEGEETRICKHGCGHTETKVVAINPDAHDMGEWELTTAPTCTTEGVETRICKRGCGHIETQVVAINPDAHDMGEWELTTVPTCTTEGEETKTCKNGCGHTETKAVAIDPNAHAWNDWTETTPGNCSTPSIYARVCSHNVAHVETKIGSIDAENHAWGEWVETTPGNCATPAVLTRTCSHNSDHTETKDGDKVADAHDMGDWTLTTVPTCTTEGVETRICKHGCGHFETQIVSIDPDAHDMGEWELTTDPTCSTEGVETKTCKRGCGHTETKAVAINPDAHNWSEWVETIPGTCVTTSVLTRTCLNNASHIENKDGAFDSDKHSYVSDCDKYCDDCGSERVTAIDHKYDDKFDAECNDCGELRSVPERIDVTVSSAKESISVGKTTTITVTLDETITASSAYVEIALGEGLKLVSGQWLIDGIIKDVDIVKNTGVIALSGSTSLSGNIFSFVVEGTSVIDAQNINVTVTFKNESVNIGVAESDTSVRVKDYTLGDVNDDGRININDMILLRRYLAGWDISINEAAADIDGVNGIKFNDAILLARHLAGWTGCELTI